MSTEALVAPDAATQIPASDTAAQPEVAEPDSNVEQQPDESQKPEEDPRDKTVKSLTRRVDRITAARYQAEARAQQAEQEAAQLRQQLAQSEQGEQSQERKQADPVTIAKQLREVEKADEQGRAVTKNGFTKFGKEAFSKAIAVVSDEIGPIMVPLYPGAELGRPTEFGKALFESDIPEEVIDYLGNNPDVAADLRGLTATQVARRIARIEIEIGKAKEPKQSNAPKALTPVKSVAKDDGGVSDNLSTEEWMRRRNKQVRG